MHKWTCISILRSPIDSNNNIYLGPHNEQATVSANAKKDKSRCGSPPLTKGPNYRVYSGVIWRFAAIFSFELFVGGEIVNYLLRDTCNIISVFWWSLQNLLDKKFNLINYKELHTYIIYFLLFIE